MKTQRSNLPRLSCAARSGHGDPNHSAAGIYHSAHENTEVGDGDACDEVAKKLTSDLAAPDGIIPVVNLNALGREQESKPEAERLLVVLLAVRNEAEYRIEGILSGADDYVPTQPELDLLKARIRSLLESGHELKETVSGQEISIESGFTVAPPDAPILSKAVKMVEEHMMDEDFSVDRFSQLMGMSRSTLKRKLKSLSRLSPQPFVQQLRMKRAARLLAAGGISVSETARMVGFYDLSHFGRVFKSHFSCTPSQYAQKGPARSKADESTADGSPNSWPPHSFGPNQNILGLCL